MSSDRDSESPTAGPRPQVGDLKSAIRGVRSLLVLGLLARDDKVLAQAEALLAEEFGPVAERSPVIPFDFTDYYEREMGKNLLRCWLGFSRFVPEDSLARTKLKTIELERRLSLSPSSSIRHSEFDIRHSGSPGRPANLDPGLLTLHNLVLASTKDFAHRVYLGSGIYAEVTLIFHQGRYEPLPWTYPDYKTDICLWFLAACRERLKP